MMAAGYLEQLVLQIVLFIQLEQKILMETVMLTLLQLIRMWIIIMEAIR